jgi:predicted metal-binding membrane protein
MADSSSLEAVLKRDRALILAGLAAITVLAWTYLVYWAWEMPRMDMAMDMAMPHLHAWGAVDFLLTFAMWGVMMIAMMIPSASPVILTFATVNRRRRAREEAFVPTGTFVLGYLLVWMGFSAVATLAQWGLHTAALLSPMMVSTSPVFGGVLLIAAGVFQWTPLKYTCLTHCRSPLGFFMTEWRDGSWGALRMGVRHGIDCVGCCWVLMALLFVAGVMNLLWIAALAAFVLIEKVLPHGAVVGRVAGGVLVLAGFVLLGQALR